MAAPLYFRQYRAKQWRDLTDEEKAACVAEVDATLPEGGLVRDVKHYGDRPVGVVATLGGEWCYMWGVRPNDAA